GETNAPVFFLTLAGTGFTPTSLVLWNGAPLATTFVNATQLRADVPLALLPGLPAATVGVFIPTTAAPAAAAPPALATVNLTPPPSGPGPYTLRVTGSGFTASSVVRWNGTAFTTSFVNDTELRVSIPAPLAQGGLPTMITVFNPLTQGGPSNPLVLGT